MKENFIFSCQNIILVIPIQWKCSKDGDSDGGSTTTDDDIELEIELFRLYGSGTDSLETNTYDTQSSSNQHFLNSYHEHDPTIV